MTSHHHISNMLQEDFRWKSFSEWICNVKNSTNTINKHNVILNFIFDDKKLDVDILQFCWTLVTIAVELYSSYCYSVAKMASRLNPPFSCNQKNITWSGLPIIDTSSIIWICVSEQLQLIRFHVVFCRYRINFLTVFQWSISKLIKYLSSFSKVYAMSGRVQTWAYIRLSTADAYEMSFI